MRPYLPILMALACLTACERKAETPPTKPKPAHVATRATEQEQATATVPLPAKPATLAVARGEALVEANCTRCHATRVGQKSPHPLAPSFATLFTNYPPEYLQEAFAEGVFVGHTDMPAFEFAPNQINDIVDYLKTLGPAQAVAAN